MGRLSEGEVCAAMRRDRNSQSSGSAASTGALPVKRFAKLRFDSSVSLTPKENRRMPQVVPGQPIETETPVVEVTVTRDKPLAPGQHRFQLVVTDDSGNVSTPAVGRRYSSRFAKTDRGARCAATGGNRTKFSAFRESLDRYPARKDCPLSMDYAVVSHLP